MEGTTDTTTKRYLRWYPSLDIGSVYTGPDPFETGMKLVRISLVFTRNLVDPVRIGSAISGTKWVHLWRWSYVEPYCFSLEPVPCKQSGSNLKQIWTHPIQCKHSHIFQVIFLRWERQVPRPSSYCAYFTPRQTSRRLSCKSHCRLDRFQNSE